MNFIKKLHGKVIECRNHKSLVQVGSKFYIINRECNVGSEVTFIKEDSKKMASYLFAIYVLFQKIYVNKKTRCDIKFLYTYKNFFSTLVLNILAIIIK